MGWQNMAARLKSCWERKKKSCLEILFWKDLLHSLSLSLSLSLYIYIYIYTHTSIYIYQYDLYLYVYLYLSQFNYKQDIILKLYNILQKLPGFRKYTNIARGMILKKSVLN